MSTKVDKRARLRNSSCMDNVTRLQAHLDALGLTPDAERSYLSVLLGGLLPLVTGDQLDSAMAGADRVEGL